MDEYADVDFYYQIKNQGAAEQGEWKQLFPIPN